jgi:hypothetical protein
MREVLQALLAGDTRRVTCSDALTTVNFDVHRRERLYQHVSVCACESTVMSAAVLQYSLDLDAPRGLMKPDSLGDALQHALRLVLAAHGNQWEPGDNLALVRCDDRLFKLIGIAVRHGASGFQRLSVHDRVRWGALMMIGGAQALRRAEERPRTYATIGALLQLPAFAAEMHGPRLDAIEDGAERHLGIQIIRSRSARRFLETMLAHSGLDLEVVEAGACRVAHCWSWAAVADAELDAINEFVRLHRASFELRPGLRALIDSDEGAFALADRLRELARFRRVVIERGLLGDSVEKTREEWKAHGLDPASFLGAPATDSLIRALFHLARARDEERTEPRFTWITSERYRGLAFALPRFLNAGNIPAEVDEIRAILIDHDGCAHGEGVRYVRNGGVFRAVRPVTIPLPSMRTAPPVQLFVQWNAEHSHELRYGSYDLPSRPVALFAHDGEYLTRPRPGMTVHLVVSSNWRLLAPPPAWTASGAGAVESWRGDVPNEPLELELEGPDGEQTFWTLGDDPQPKLAVRRGKHVPGLRLGGAPVLRAWPELEAEGLHGRVTLTIDGPGGREELRVLARNGRIRFDARGAPGMYTVRAARVRQSAPARFLYLPGATFVVEHLAPDAVGARPTRLAVSGAPALLTPTDTEARIVNGAVAFPAGTSGTREVGVALPGFRLAGTWKVVLHPCAVRLLVDGQKPLTEPWPLRDCTVASILEITGDPATPVDLEVLGTRFEVVLGSEGVRRLRLVELPSFAGHEKGRVVFRWPSDRIEVEFRNHLLEPPSLSSDGRVAVLGARTDLNHDVYAEVLPAWEPWVEFQRRSARLVMNGATRKYEVDLPEAPGRYFIGLAHNNRPETGLRLAEVPGERPAFASPLCRLLWERDTPIQALRAALAYEPWERLEHFARNVNRYGREYFNAAAALCDVSGRALAQVLAHGRAAEETALYRLLAQHDLDLFVLRYSDLDRIVPAGTDVLAAMELLDELAGRALGLVIAAARRWPPGSFNSERFSEIIAPWAAISTGLPVTLGADDIDLVRTPDAPELVVHRERTTRSPRVQGLIQARKAESALERGPLREVARRYLGHAEPGPDYWRVAGIEPKRLPPATARFDAVALAAARAVHAWRSGHGDIAACRDARHVARHARALMDYWLNLLSAQDTGVDA